MRRPRLLAAGSSRDRWFLIQALSLPALAIGVLLTLGGCSSMGGRTPATETGAEVPASGNQWSRQLEAKREAIARATAGTGIAIARTTDNQLKLNVPADFSFDAGRADIKPTLRPLLDELGRQLDPEVRVTIVGHTDAVGGAAVNDPLSLDRAEAVREYLVSHGVRRGRLLVEGRGGRQPVASNATESGRAANRRIEIFLSQPAS